MKTIKNLMFLSLILLSFSCVEKYDKIEVVSYYPDSIPQMEIYYNYYGNQLLMAKEIRYFSNGQINSIGRFDEKEQKTGEWIYYFDSGKKWRVENYKEGKKDGKTTEWYMNGEKMFEGYYIGDLPDGKWTIYNEDGSKQGSLVYKDGQVIKK